MTVDSLIITGFLDYNSKNHNGIDVFKAKWDTENTAFREQIASYAPEFLNMQITEVIIEDEEDEDNEEVPVVRFRIEIDFQIDSTLFALFFDEGAEPAGSSYEYSPKAKAAAATLLERVLWIPQVAPRIIGAWDARQYGIATYTVNSSTRIPAIFPLGPGDGGTRGG